MDKRCFSSTPEPHWPFSDVHCPCLAPSPGPDQGCLPPCPNAHVWACACLLCLAYSGCCNARRPHPVPALTQLRQNLPLSAYWDLSCPGSVFLVSDVMFLYISIQGKSDGWANGCAEVYLSVCKLYIYTHNDHFFKKQDFVFCIKWLGFDLWSINTLVSIFQVAIISSESFKILASRAIAPLEQNYFSELIFFQAGGHH